MERVWNKLDTNTLQWGGSWADAQSTIRAVLFGTMVDLARDRIKHYRSDLYHDALWISENITGPRQFDWVVRESGTFIGEVVQYVSDDDWTDTVRYRFDIRVENDRKWILDIYEAGPIVPVNPHFCEECGVNVAQHVEYMEMWLCSDFCTGKAEARLGAFYTAPNVPDTMPWVDKHAALDVSECDVAKAIEGCIFHPAPVGGWTMVEDLGDKIEELLDVSCTGYKENGSLQHDGDTCPVHENGLGIKFPTLRNVEQNAPKRKVIQMDSILRDLREKLDEARSAYQELEDVQEQISESKDELESYIDDVESLLGSLDDLPSVSVSVSIDVDFDA